MQLLQQQQQLLLLPVSVAAAAAVGNRTMQLNTLQLHSQNRRYQSKLLLLCCTSHSEYRMEQQWLQLPLAAQSRTQDIWKMSLLLDLGLQVL